MSDHLDVERRLNVIHQQFLTEQLKFIKQNLNRIDKQMMIMTAVLVIFGAQVVYLDHEIQKLKVLYAQTTYSNKMVPSKTAMAVQAASY